MIETLAAMPPAFWVVVLLLGRGFYWSGRTIASGTGIPVAMVLATIAIWYVGDVLYNDYRDWHMMLFPPEVLTAAWWQVAIFLGAFLLLTPILHKRINRRLLGQSSQVMALLKEGVENPGFQRGLVVMCRAASGVWCCLAIGAAFRFRENLLYYFCPYLGGYAGPWVINGVADGGTDSLLALANYLQLMVGALFGIIAALSTDPWTRRVAMVGVAVTWPYYIFDRTRKFILAIAVPGILAWVFLRLRGGMLRKALALGALSLVLSAWFGFLIGHRTDSVITDALTQEGFDFFKESEVKHQGLNMYEELAWITLLTSEGTYSPDWGQNYFANLVNPIPRAIWAGKPTIGLDYAVARGQGGGDTGSGVHTTLSDGVVGQGIVNFGLNAGPIFAALLAGLWVCWLARLDLDGRKLGYLPLYSLGLILTFNMGRDITFLELYPFVFGFGLCVWLNRRVPRRSVPEEPQVLMQNGCTPDGRTVR